ncbi:hypothetical protein PENTCL1PPCAC_21713, partial [Pristionchus entomophagus]
MHRIEEMSGRSEHNLWWSIRSSKSGDEAREKLQSCLKHIVGVHSWEKDRNFKLIKKCASHPATHVARVPLLDPKKGAFKALEALINSKSVMDQIGRISPDIGTSEVEGFNHLAGIHAPKDHYFSEKGHDLRSRVTILRHNSAQ